MTGTVHIVGAGLAGLSAALHAMAAGREVIVYEGSPQAGGRCRSYHDARLDRQIDNGNHLVLTGNRSVAEYLKLAGAPDALQAADEARFPFVDIKTGERWTVHMNDGPVPWWAFDSRRRPKGVGLADMIRAGMILFAGPQHTISALCGSEGPARSRFWEPMAMAVINLPPEKASAQLMRATALEAWRDGRLARPMFAPKGLGPALVAPALKALDEAGSPVRYGHLLRNVEREHGRVKQLHFARGEPVRLDDGDSVILAIPAHRLTEILPETDPPTETSSILNAHFLLEDPSVLEGAPKILGTVNSLTQWIFVKGDIVSLTISAAGDLADEPAEQLIPRLWADTARALELEDMRFEQARIIKEKRATFDQSPEGIAKRRGPRTAYSNLFLAGDWTNTGLPATIEGSIRSGETLARLLLARSR